MNSKHTVFFIWQSNNPEIKNKIKESIKQAICNINNRSNNVKYEYDEATYKTTGSPDIVQEIQLKIPRAEVVIADASAVLSLKKEGTKIESIPNLNVIYEIGIATQALGVERVIILFDQEYSPLPGTELFDINHRRFSSINCSDEKLTKKIQKYIEEIIEKNPLKPFAEIDLQRMQDIQILSSILPCFFAQEFWIDYFSNVGISAFPHKYVIMGDIFRTIYQSPQFQYFFDMQLEKLFEKFYHFAIEEIFDPASNIYELSIHNPDMMILGPQTKYCSEIPDKIEKNINNAKNALTAITKYLKRNYPEINLFDIDKKAKEYINK